MGGPNGSWGSGEGVLTEKLTLYLKPGGGLRPGLRESLRSVLGGGTCLCRVPGARGWVGSVLTEAPVTPGGILESRVWERPEFSLFLLLPPPVYFLSPSPTPATRKPLLPAQPPSSLCDPGKSLPSPRLRFLMCVWGSGVAVEVKVRKWVPSVCGRRAQ